MPFVVNEKSGSQVGGMFMTIDWQVLSDIPFTSVMYKQTVYVPELVKVIVGFPATGLLMLALVLGVTDHV
jgi:hypothetical protein